MFFVLTRIIINESEKSFSQTWGAVTFLLEKIT